MKPLERNYMLLLLGVWMHHIEHKNCIGFVGGDRRVICIDYALMVQDMCLKRLFQVKMWMLTQ